MVKTSPYNAGSVPGQRVKIPHTSLPKINTKTLNGNYIVTNSIKTLKIVHIRKKKINKTRLRKMQSCGFEDGGRDHEPNEPRNVSQL